MAMPLTKIMGTEDVFKCDGEVDGTGLGNGKMVQNMFNIHQRYSAVMFTEIFESRNIIV